MRRISVSALPHMKDADIDAVTRVLRSGNLVQGEQVSCFEAEFSQTLEGRHCVAVSSGTSALHLSLLAIGAGPGQEVIVPSFTFGATAHAVALTGAAPVFADIDPVTFCLDPVHVQALITRRTTAVIPVHLFGHPAPMAALLELAAQHGFAVIEDAAQAVASSLHDRPIGTFGDLACFSFYPTKNMHSIEGGMIATADANLAAKLRLLRNQGMDERYHYAIVGLNARMTDVAAAVGRTQLQALPGRTAVRVANAARLSESLAGVIMPVTAAGARHVFHQYVIRAHDRDQLAAHLERQGIGCAVHYPVPVHRSPAYHSEEVLPATERACTEVLSLPVHPDLGDRDLDRIAAAVNAR